MSEEILVNVTPQETRVARVENGLLQEITIERQRNQGIAGTIYIGRVVRVLRGMQAAFVDIGLERTAFLHCRDLCHGDGPKATGLQQANPDDCIDKHLTQGQRLLVQVVKDPIGSKGARLTGQISIPSRHLVLLLGSSDIGISQRITDPEERERLLAMVEGVRDELGIKYGFILRTAAETASVEQMHAEMKLLVQLANTIKTRENKAPVTSRLYRDLPLLIRTLRDLHWNDVDKVRIDSRETLKCANDFCRDYLPQAVPLLEHYPGGGPIFDLYGIEDEIQKALQNRVPLKSGGYLIIDQTEAMTTIDINTGSFVGTTNLEETIFKTNLEATTVIARQLRVRNLCGMIIVDFIDMAEQEHSDQVLRSLQRELERDRTKTKMNPMSRLSLVEITRKRTNESLASLLTETCPACEGRGRQKTIQTVCYEIFREILREARQFDAQKYLIVAAPDIIDALLEDESEGFAELHDFIGRPIDLKFDASYHQEAFDIVLM